MHVFYGDSTIRGRPKEVSRLTTIRVGSVKRPMAGLPTTCSDARADVLLPMQRAYKDFLAMIGMQQTINTAAEMCGGGH